MGGGRSQALSDAAQQANFSWDHPTKTMIPLIGAEVAEEHRVRETASVSEHGPSDQGKRYTLIGWAGKE